MRLVAALLTATAAVAACLTPTAGQARVTRLDITKVEPAFAGQAFPGSGAYELLTGKAHGEVDPRAAANAVIQDVALAPRNARGMVEYTTDIPDNNAVRVAGDGWLQRRGYTLVWFGWQADVLAGGGRMTSSAPVARNRDGSPITGLVRSELVVTAPATTLPLSAGWFTTGTHAAYPTVSTDNQAPAADGFLPTLTARARENAPRVAIWRPDARDTPPPRTAAGPLAGKDRHRPQTCSPVP